MRWTLRFPGRHGLDGVQSLTFTPADESAWAAEWIASEAARELGLLAAPSGFAAVSVNGGPPELAFWQEGIGATLLDRLRRAPGELVTTNAPSLSRDASRETRIVRRQLATLAALVEQPDDALFARRIPELLDVEKLLRWDALSWALGEPHRRAAPGWYFDSITGLLEPVLAGGGSTQLDATLLTARILRVPHYRARRDEVLRQLARTDGGLVARASTLVAGLARRVVPAQPLLDRLDSLRAFSRIDGELRARLLQRRRTLDRWLDQFEQRPMSENPAVALAAASKTRDRSTPVLDLRDTGLPLRVDGDRLILPAGTHRLQRTPRRAAKPSARPRGGRRARARTSCERHRVPRTRSDRNSRGAHPHSRGAGRRTLGHDRCRASAGAFPHRARRRVRRLRGDVAGDRVPRPARIQRVRRRDRAQ